MAIEYLDGIRLYRSLSIGLKKVISRQDYLNKINVFPVPDNDTGTNMAYTLSSIEEEISDKIYSNVEQMSESIADAALDGARGNSGAILAQFFVGFAEGIKTKTVLSTADFGRGLKTAKDFAYEALAKPREGTILSVISDWSKEIREHCESINDFSTLMKHGLKRAQSSLEKTPEQLEVLAKAGVVDAGGQGFVDLMSGIQEFIENGAVENISNIKIMEPVESLEAEINETFQFCTECIITGDDIDRDSLKKELMANGDSLVLAGSRKKAKVHIHTDEPKTIMEICEKYGLVSGEKADDMFRQQKDAHKEHGSIALVVDSGCDLPEEMLEELDIHVVPVRLNFGEKHYVDKMTMSTSEFWEEVKKNPIHPQTSQPAPGDFKRQYQFLASHYESAISIHIPEAASGTYQSAVTASRSLGDFPVHVMDSYNGSVGQGLIAWSAAEAIKDGKTIDEVVKEIETAIENTSIYIGLNTLENAVKGGRVSPAVRTVANLLKINPILSLSSKGVKAIGRTFGHKNKFDKFYNYLLKQLPENGNARIGIGHVQNKETAEKYKNSFSYIVGSENVFVCEAGPALSVHAGLNAVFVGIQKQ